jgi:lipase
MFERFESRLPYSDWSPVVLSDYCEHGLTRSPDGKYELACPPEVEAAIYAGAGSVDIHVALSRIQIPVVVLRARPQLGDAAGFDFSSSPTWSELATRFPNGRDVHYPQLTHFIPMQVPEVVAEHVRQARTAH